MLVAAIIIGVISLALLKVLPLILMLIRIIRAGKRFPNFYPNPHWFFGDVKNLDTLGSKAGNKVIEAHIKRGTPVTVLWKTFIDPYFIIYDPDIAKIVLRRADGKPMRFNLNYGLVRPWLGLGLVLSSGKKWERNRKMLTPGFHFQVLKPYIEIYNRSTDVLLEKLSEFSKGGKSIDVSPIMRKCTLEIILLCAMSYKVDLQGGDTPEYVRRVGQILGSLKERVRNPLYLNEFIFYNFSKIGKTFKANCDFVHEFAENLIDERLRSPTNKNKKKYLDFIDILINARDEHDKGLSREEMRCEVDTFSFAGHDTTAASSSWFMYTMAKYQDAQARVYEEIMSVLGDREDLEWDDIPKLKYTSMAMKETMRLIPTIQNISRELAEPLFVNGLEIPTGSTIGVSILGIHHNDRLWDNPEEFRPERFTDENSAGRNPYAFVPFSAGPRNCIGQAFALHELKVILSRVIKRFHLTLEPDYEPIITLQAVTGSENGIKVIFNRRA